MKKPSFFTLKDFLMIGNLPIVSTIITIAMLFTFPFGEALALMITVSVVFWGIYIRLLFLRKAELDKFTFIDGKNFALMVDFGDYSCDNEDLLRATENALEKWENIYENTKEKMKGTTFKVFFKEMPITVPGRVEFVDGKPKLQKLTGYTIFYSSTINVGFKSKDQSLETTAFEHEIGHVIQGKVTGVWDEKKHHEVSKENGIK